MKKLSAPGLACAALMAVAFVPVNPLVGRWQRQFADGRMLADRQTIFTGESTNCEETVATALLFHD